MNKSQLVRNVHERAGVSQVIAARAVDATFDAICEALANGEDVSVPGFGSFKVKVQSAREGRNLHTGETMMSPAKHVAKFAAGKNLKDQVAQRPV